MKFPSVIADTYEVHGVLGEGGTGVVYDAVRLTDGRAIALKVMHQELAGDEQIRGRFRREAAILQRLEGRHVCPMLEFGEVPAEGDSGKTVLFIALPKIEGRSLETVLRASGPLPVERVLDILMEITVALGEAHERGIIHRDLKPANVLLTALPDGRSSVVVVDFGMSKIITGTGGSGTTNLTAHNMLFGTPEYMSPEQARGDELDARCDVYAAGVILYEMLTGAPPFTGPTALGVLTMHLTGELELPSRRAAPGRVTPALDAVCLHALARDPKRRYPSAEALGNAVIQARGAPKDTQAVLPSASPPPSGTPSRRAEALANTELALATVPPPAPRPLAEPERDAPPPVSLTPPPRSSPRPSAPPRPSHRTGSGPPSNRRRPVAALVADPPLSKAWIAVWVAATVTSVGVGVWLALR